MRQIKGYGYKRDLPDHRDKIFEPSTPANILPKAWMLTSKMPPIYDQGQLGSCTGNGWARVLEHREIVQGQSADTPSRLFIYYAERDYEGTTDQDAGAEVRTGAKVVSKLGAPSETDWPYDISRFTEKPSAKAYADAKKHEALEYRRIVNGTPGCPLRSALFQGLPIVFGFSVPDYFESGWDYHVPLPLPSPDTQIVGGHCVVIVGYDFSVTRLRTPAFLCDNSWGVDWGIGGRFWLDYRWFGAGLADDLWVISKVT